MLHFGFRGKKGLARDFCGVNVSSFLVFNLGLDFDFGFEGCIFSGFWFFGVSGDRLCKVFEVFCVTFSNF